jgi:hypothetical protein
MLPPNRPAALALCSLGANGRVRSRLFLACCLSAKHVTSFGWPRAARWLYEERVGVSVGSPTSDVVGRLFPIGSLGAARECEHLLQARDQDVGLAGAFGQLFDLAVLDADLAS